MLRSPNQYEPATFLFP